MTDTAAPLSRPVRRRRSHVWPIAAGFALLLLLAGSLLFARALMLRDSVLPGVSVAGVDVGGLSHSDARARLRAEMATRLSRPLTVQVGDRSLVVRPDRLWRFDAAATERRAAQAGRESVRSRLLALTGPFAEQYEVEPVLELRPAAERRVLASLERLTPTPRNARLSMDGSDVVLVAARWGTTVDGASFLAALEDAALVGKARLVAETSPLRPDITTRSAMRTQAQAQTIVSAPVTIRFRREAIGELGPTALAGMVRFSPADGRYRVSLDRAALAEKLVPMVAAKTTEPVDAGFRVVGERVRVIPARPGTQLAPARAQRAVRAAALQPDARAARVALTKLPADLTTREARALGIRQQLTSFTTDMGESSANRIWNVHLLGDYLDGTIIKPGQVFSYNAEVGPRTVERGFREGQMIFGGVLIPSIGGGVCQTATTVFNAAFETGLPIKSRTNHSFYISHYPMGRDATVSWGGPDLVFKNDLKHAILIKVSYTDATFTVSFYGTKQRRKIVSSTSGTTNYTQPRLQYAVDPSAPPNSVRTASGGGPGFDVNVHRKVYERGKLIREDDFFTRYVPQNPTAIYGPGRTPPGPFFYLPAT
jgi:vancomycin resistance protein YoaR